MVQKSPQSPQKCCGAFGAPFLAAFTVGDHLSQNEGRASHPKNEPALSTVGILRQTKSCPNISRGQHVSCPLGAFSGVATLVASFVPCECPVGGDIWGIFGKPSNRAIRNTCCTDDMFEISVRHENHLVKNSPGSRPRTGPV